MALAVPVAAADGTSAPTGAIGVVPPNNPPSICPIDYKTDPLVLINRCRKREGVGPMVLPSNYNSLPQPQPQQMLVVFNLERVGRGLPPIVGLNAAMDSLAQAGADANNDPNFPPDSGDGGGDWATSQTVLGAVYEWMYNDGLGFDCKTGAEPDSDTVTSGPAEWQGGGTKFVRGTGGKGVAESVSLCDKGHQTGPVAVTASVPGLASPVTWSFTVA
jgi:hypothetical protein